jgi:hypothetical protein
MVMDKPEWIHCVIKDRTEKIIRVTETGTLTAESIVSWCGKTIGREFCFSGSDHALSSILQNTRLQPCEECMAEIYNTVGSYLYG